MLMKFHGIVSIGDDYRVREDEEHGAIFVGELDVVGSLRANKDKFKGPVTVGIADERFQGPLAVETGWGYSEYTPMDPDILSVGPHNLIDIVSRYHGQTISLWVSDEPINILE